MNTPDLEQTFLDAADALYRSEPEEAAALFAAGVAAAGAVDTEALADTLERRAAQKHAVDTLFSKYPQIRADGDMSALADVYVDRHLRQGKRIEVAIAEAGEELATKFGLGQHKPTSTRRSSQTGDTPDAEVDEQRAAVLEGVAWLKATRNHSGSQ